MKAASFDSTPEFKHFKEVMRRVIAVPKKRLDELVAEAKENSPRNGDPHAQGRGPRNVNVDDDPSSLLNPMGDYFDRNSQQCGDA